MGTPGFFSFFTDAVLRAPTIGCTLMCMAASLIGCVVVLRKESLIGEALSHAAYPGMILGIVCAGALSIGESDELPLTLIVLLGAFLTAIAGLWAIQMLVKSARVPPDAALCFVLSSFFGIGLTLASEVQFSYTALYKQALNYFYGQAATMTDIHIYLYGAFVVIVILAIVIFYKEIQASAFDSSFAKSIGIPLKLIDSMILFLTVSAVIIGIRSVGVILMSAMLIAPAVAARQMTNRLSMLFLWSGFFGGASGFFGNYFSVTLTTALEKWYPTARIILPTGPMIVLTAAGICMIAIFFAPERGIFARFWRRGRFRYSCICENLLKSMRKIDSDGSMSLDQIAQIHSTSKFFLALILYRLQLRGWVMKESSFRYRLTPKGRVRAAHVVRLHRLWEVYLAHHLEVGIEKVHRNAEEMEHILTPELEQALTLLLEDPKHDPHFQPIPSQEEAHAF